MAKVKQEVSAEEYQALDEATRAFYVMRNDRYFLDTDEAEALRTSLSTARSERDAMVKRVSELDALLKAEQEKAKKSAKRLEDGASDAEKYAELKSRFEAQVTLAEEFEQERDKLRKAEEELRQRYHASLLSSVASAAIAEHGGIPKILTPIVTAKLAVKEVDGKEQVIVLDEKGVPRLRSGKEGDYVSPSELVKEMREDKDMAATFRGTGVSGSGAIPPAGGEPQKPTQPQAKVLAQHFDD